MVLFMFSAHHEFTISSMLANALPVGVLMPHVLDEYVPALTLGRVPGPRTDTAENPEPRSLRQSPELSDPGKRALIHNKEIFGISV